MARMIGKQDRICPYVCCKDGKRNKAYRARERRLWRKDYGI